MATCGREGLGLSRPLRSAVMENDNVITEDTSVDEQAAPAVTIEEELLVEEISIDGMCGVY